MIEKSIKEMLRQIYIENGEVIFLNTDKLKGVLADKSYSYPNEKKRLFLAINENIVYKRLGSISANYRQNGLLL